MQKFTVTFSITWPTTGGGYTREATVKRLRAGQDGHRSAPDTNTGQPPPKIHMPAPSLWEITIWKAETEKTGISLIIPIKINGLKVSAVVDTAAEGTILSTEAFGLLRKKPQVLEEVRLKGLNGQAPITGKCIRGDLGIGSQTYKWYIYVADSVDMCLLGLDFLHNYKVDIKLSTNTISINGEEIHASVVRSGETDIKVSRVKLARRVVIPPNTVQTVTGEAGHTLEGDVILQPVNQHKHLLMPRSLGKCSNKEVLVRVCNPTDKYVTLKKGYHVGYLEEVDEIFKRGNFLWGRFTSG